MLYLVEYFLLLVALLPELFESHVKVLVVSIQEQEGWSLLPWEQNNPLTA